MPWSLRNLLLYEGGIVLLRDESLPVEWRVGIARDERLPVEWRSDATQVSKDEVLPVEWFAQGTRVSQNEQLPVEWTGGNPNSLLLIWNVRNALQVPFVLQWNVVSRRLSQNLTLRWNVRQRLTPLVLRWNVIPDLLNPLINSDVQQPIITITKTP